MNTKICPMFIFALSFQFSLLAFSGPSDLCSGFREKTSTCHYPQLNADQISASLTLSEKMKQALLQIEHSENLKGRPFKVALINRQGLDLKNISLLKEINSQGQERTLNQLLREATTENPDSFPGQTSVDYQYLYNERNLYEKLDYTHLGILVRNDPKSKPSEGDWIAYQLLWNCKGNQSEIHRSYLEKFFLDELSGYRSQIMILPIEVQDRIETLLLRKKSEITKNFHANSKSYNAAAHWTILEEQNSNQWVLEVLAASLYPIGDIKNRTDALRALIATRYQPSQVFLTGFYSLITLPGAYKLLPNTACLKNQPYALQYGVGEVVTSISILKYLKRNQLLTGLYEVDKDAR